MMACLIHRQAVTLSRAVAGLRLLSERQKVWEPVTGNFLQMQACFARVCVSSSGQME